jgi:hypothetical protein
MVMLSYLAGLVSLACLIFVLTKMYPKEGLVKTILGFICALYAFIWGWLHIKTEEDANFKTAMYVWTGAIVLSIILSVIIQSLNDVASALGG